MLKDELACAVAQCERLAPAVALRQRCSGRTNAYLDRAMAGHPGLRSQDRPRPSYRNRHDGNLSLCRDDERAHVKRQQAGHAFERAFGKDDQSIASGEYRGKRA